MQKQKIEAEKSKNRAEAKAKRERELLEKKGVLPDGHDDVIDELVSVIEDGKAFRNRRKGKGGRPMDNIFARKQEERVREKPLPQFVAKPKPKSLRGEKTNKSEMEDNEEGNDDDLYDF